MQCHIAEDWRHHQHCCKSLQTCPATSLQLHQQNAHYTRSDNKVHELIVVKVLHTSLLNTTMVAFKVLPLGSYAPMPAPSPPFKTILELVLWNDLQSCRCITPDVISVIKMPSFNIFFIFGARSGGLVGCSNTVICLVAKNSSLLLFFR